VKKCLHNEREGKERWTEYQGGRKKEGCKNFNRPNQEESEGFSQNGRPSFTGGRERKRKGHIWGKGGKANFVCHPPHSPPGRKREKGKSTTLAERKEKKKNFPRYWSLGKTTKRILFSRPSKEKKRKKKREEAIEEIGGKGKENRCPAIWKHTGYF